MSDRFKVLSLSDVSLIVMFARSPLIGFIVISCVLFSVTFILCGSGLNVIWG